MRQLVNVELSFSTERLSASFANERFLVRVDPLVLGQGIALVVAAVAERTLELFLGVRTKLFVFVKRGNLTEGPSAEIAQIRLFSGVVPEMLDHICPREVFLAVFTFLLPVVT